MTPFLRRLHPIRLPFARLYTSKSNTAKLGPTSPFSEDNLKGDDKYADLNNYYSDMFTGNAAPGTSGTNEPGNIEDEIEDINNELNALYGVDNEAFINELDESSTPQQTRTLLDYLKENRPLIVRSTSSNPYKNLALEDYIFQNTPFAKTTEFKAHRLIFYVNSPCVVIGKNQNPWKEVNLPVLNELQIPLVRRKSGGGTVVHDLRNVNYSFINTREHFQRDYFGSVIVNKLNQLKICEELTQNERGDIITSKARSKVSGSAFKISKGKSYHHGTMLLDSNLSVLRQLLKKEGQEHVEVKCNAVDSVPSKVTNLKIENEDFIAAVVNAFDEQYGVETPYFEINDDEIPEEVTQISDQLQTWEWKYGATPKFEMIINHDQFKLTLYVVKGILQDFKVEGNSTHFKFLRQVLDHGETVRFEGSSIVGYIIDDTISEWIGQSIDGTS